MTSGSSELTLPALDRRRATDEVYEVMRRSILTNAFKPGQRIPVDGIARQLGVSLTPVRHAVQQLATEGLIEIRPRSGSFVASLDARDIAETFDIRRALECLAAESAAASITEEQLGRARRLVSAMAEPVRTTEDRVRHESDNSEFHRLILDAAGNERLTEMYEALRAHLQIARVHSAHARAHPPQFHRECAEHEAILAALEKRDAAALIAALHTHINRAKTSLLSQLSALPP